MSLSVNSNDHTRPCRARAALARGAALAILCAASLAACRSDRPPPPTGIADQRPRLDASPDSPPTHGAADSLRALAATHGIVALPPPPPVRKELVRLGQALVFDPILSGNRNMACMSCHLPAFATGDQRNLSIGQGGIGLGPDRRIGRGMVIPRNAPPLFNLASLATLFWDGRVSTDALGSFHTPANAQLTPAMTRVFELGAVSAIGMFPVVSRSEMRGITPIVQTNALPSAATASLIGGNELGQFADSDFTGIWQALMVRLGRYPEYRQMFEAAYPGTPFSAMTFANASNAMAGFIVDQMTFTNSRWDQFLAGNDTALDPQQFRGAATFMNTKCAGCHNGVLFTDGKSRNVALAQFGPGEGNGPGGHDDFGRMNVTGVAADKYAFRTSPLRNVELTRPYGHAGQFADLRSFVDHYSESDVKLAHYDVNQIDPTLRGTLLPNTADILATRSGALIGFVLTAQQVDDLTAYLRALTDQAARDLRQLTPGRVPSGLPVPGGGDAGAGPFNPRQ